MYDHLTVPPKRLACLIASRVVQAIGGCAGLALGRAIARDTASDQSATKKLAVLAAAMSFGPGIASLVSTQASGIVGWRGLFVWLAFANAILLMITVLTLDETHRMRASISVRTYAGQWRALLINRYFMGNCVGRLKR